MAVLPSLGRRAPELLPPPHFDYASRALCACADVDMAIAFGLRDMSIHAPPAATSKYAATWYATTYLS